MRVSIDHKEKSTGLVFKKPAFAVNVNVQFSEEEKAIINTRKLKDYIVLRREHSFNSAVRNDPTYQDDDIKPHLRVKSLMKGSDSYDLPDPVRAKEYEQHLVDALKTLKSFLEGSHSVGESRTFDL